MSGLGIKLEQIIFYIICFVITMIILDKFLFKKIVEILNKREAEIERALNEKDELEDKLAHVNREADKIVHDAKENARHILEEAREAVEPEKQRLLDLAKKESDQIVVEARRKAEDVLVSARLKSQEEALDLLKAILAKAMAKFEIASEEQKNILSKIVNTKL
jgi:F-type H+-transporting ATPase subunit b